MAPSSFMRVPRPELACWGGTGPVVWAERDLGNAFWLQLSDVMEKTSKPVLGTCDRRCCLHYAAYNLSLYLCFELRGL